MYLERFSNNQKTRLAKVLKLLETEHKIVLDFNDLAQINTAKEIAQSNVDIIKNASVSVFEETNKHLAPSYLVLEAVKLNNEINMKRINEEHEIHKAEYLLASKNIVDDLQKMLEKLSDIQAQQLPAIVDKMKLDAGVAAAENYKTTAATLLAGVIDSINSTKEGMDNLTLGLSGDVDMSGASADMATQEPAMDDVDLGTEEPEVPAEEPKKMVNPLGRERKEESKKKSGKTLNEAIRGLKEPGKYLVNKAENFVVSGPWKLASEAFAEREDYEDKDQLIVVMNDGKRVFQVNRNGEAIGNDLNESKVTENKKWRVTVEEPAKKLTIAKKTVEAKSFAEASNMVKKSVMMQKGLKEWNKDFEIFVKPIKESKEEITSSGLKVWHVQAKAPESDKLFGNYKAYAPSKGLAIAKAKKAVEKKHGTVEVVFTIKEMNKDQVVKEAWENKMHTNPKDKGKWEGWTKEELKHKLSSLQKKKEHSDEETKTIKQLEFALRAKGKGKKHTSRWGKVKESFGSDWITDELAKRIVELGNGCDTNNDVDEKMINAWEKLTKKLADGERDIEWTAEKIVRSCTDLKMDAPEVYDKLLNFAETKLNKLKKLADTVKESNTYTSSGYGHIKHNFTDKDLKKALDAEIKFYKEHPEEFTSKQTRSETKQFLNKIIKTGLDKISDEDKQKLFDMHASTKDLYHVKESINHDEVAELAKAISGISSHKEYKHVMQSLGFFVDDEQRMDDETVLSALSVAPDHTLDDLWSQYGYESVGQDKPMNEAPATANDKKIVLALVFDDRESMKTQYYSASITTWNALGVAYKTQKLDELIQKNPKLKSFEDVISCDLDNQIDNGLYFKALKKMATGAKSFDMTESDISYVAFGIDKKTAKYEAFDKYEGEEDEFDEFDESVINPNTFADDCTSCLKNPCECVSEDATDDAIKKVQRPVERYSPLAFEFARAIKDLAVELARTRGLSQIDALRKAFEDGLPTIKSRGVNPEEVKKFLKIGQFTESKKKVTEAFKVGDKVSVKASKDLYHGQIGTISSIDNEENDRPYYDVKFDSGNQSFNSSQIQNITEAPNSAQTITAQQKPMPSMYKPSAANLPATKPAATPAANSTTPTQKPETATFSAGDQVTHNGQKTTVASDNGDMVGVQDSPNSIVRMVPKSEVQKNVTESKKHYDEEKEKFAKNFFANFNDKNGKLNAYECMEDAWEKYIGTNNVKENVKNARKIQMTVETMKGRKGCKTFESEADAKAWMHKHGHNLKSVKLDEEVVPFTGNKTPTDDTLTAASRTGKRKTPIVDLKTGKVEESETKKRWIVNVSYKINGKEEKRSPEVFAKDKHAVWEKILTNLDKNPKCSEINMINIKEKTNENATAGATSAGGIASIPKSFGTVQRRKPVDEDNSDEALIKAGWTKGQLSGRWKHPKLTNDEWVRHTEATKLNKTKKVNEDFHDDQVSKIYKLKTTNPTAWEAKCKQLGISTKAGKNEIAVALVKRKDVNEAGMHDMMRKKFEKNKKDAANQISDADALQMLQPERFTDYQGDTIENPTAKQVKLALKVFQKYDMDSFEEYSEDLRNEPTYETRESCVRAARELLQTKVN